MNISVMPCKLSKLPFDVVGIQNRQ